jgi:transposase
METDLVLLLANGLSIRSAARVAGVSRRSLTRWLADGLRERVAKAREARPESTDSMTEARLVVAIARAAALGDWRAGAWLLSRRWPERWAASDYASGSNGR